VVADGSIENVVVGFPDIYGRLMGKRFDADFFLTDVRLVVSFFVACPAVIEFFFRWHTGFEERHTRVRLSAGV
jgi:hypothetical protein